MLSEEEKANVNELLSFLCDEDITALANACTHNTIEFDSREDGLKAILLHESSYATILGRKKVTKGLLFNYLHHKNISLDTSLNKSSLALMVIDYWKSKETSERDGSILDKQLTKTQENDSKKDENSESQNMANLLAKQFTDWFYKRLNEDFTKSGGEVLEAKDLWPDCETTVNLSDSPDDSSQCHEVSNAQDSVALLRGLTTRYDIYLSPNITLNGIKVKCDPTGLIIVQANGTIHTRQGVCIGIFKQTFGLIADPMSENNYKIKRTSLSLTSGGISQPPSAQALLSE